jgi:hypothetical protein
MTTATTIAIFHERWRGNGAWEPSPESLALAGAVTPMPCSLIDVLLVLGATPFGGEGLAVSRRLGEKAAPG